MSKITTQQNHRVVVEPWIIGKHDAKYAERKCKDLISEIKRHVDDIGQIWHECDTVVTCSHCGYGWEVDENGEPLCCTAAQEEFQLSKQKENHETNS